MRDRLWFFGNARDDRHVSGLAEPVRQQERRRPERLDVRAPTRSVKVRNATSKKIGATAPDLAGHAEEQVRVLHRLHEELHRLVACRRTAAQCRAAGRRVDGVGPGIGPGVGDDVARVGHDLGRAREDHAGDVDVAALEPRAASRPATRRSGREWGDIRPAAPLTDLIRGDGAVDDRRDADRELHLSRLAGDRPARSSRTRSTARRCPTSPARTT